MQQSRLFSEFVCSQYQSELMEAIQDFSFENSDIFSLKVVEDVSSVGCEDINPKKVFIRDLPGLELEFDLVVEAELNVCEYSHRCQEEEPVTQWFIIKGILEDELTRIARESKRYDVLTKNTSKTPIAAAGVAMMNIFISNARILLSALNYRVLEPLENAHTNNNPLQQLLELKTKKASGTGFLTPEGQFAIMAGSKLSETTAIKCPDAALKAREKAKRERKVINYLTQEEMVFKSSSLAAAFLAGFSISGPEYWKTKDGMSLKEIQKNNEE